MRIFKDIISDDDLITDSYNLKEVDGIVYEVDCRAIQVGADGAEIGTADDEEGDNEGRRIVIDIPFAFRMARTTFEKKEYFSYISGYIKRVKDNLEAQGKSPEEIANFHEKAGAYVKKIIARFNGYTFYVGQSLNPEAMVILLNYRDDGTTPYVTLWKHGLKETEG